MAFLRKCFLPVFKVSLILPLGLRDTWNIVVAQRWPEGYCGKKMVVACGGMEKTNKEVIER